MSAWNRNVALISYLGGNGRSDPSIDGVILDAAPPLFHPGTSTGGDVNKTPYHKRLEAIRDKILVNEKDPSRFKRLELLNGLYGLESTIEKKPFDAWLAII